MEAWKTMVVGVSYGDVAGKKVSLDILALPIGRKMDLSKLWEVVVYAQQALTPGRAP